MRSKRNPSTSSVRHETAGPVLELQHGEVASSFGQRQASAEPGDAGSQNHGGHLSVGTQSSVAGTSARRAVSQGLRTMRRAIR